MKKIKPFVKYAVTAIIFLIFSDSVLAQLFQAYKQYSNHINGPSKIMEDVFGDVIILTPQDATYPFGGSHWNVAKYGPNGNFLWDYTYAAIDTAYYNAPDMALDGSGNIFVTSQRAIAIPAFWIYANSTVKISGAGNVIWEQIYTLPNDSNGVYSSQNGPKITFDPSGNNLAITFQASWQGVSYLLPRMVVIKYDNLGNLLIDAHIIGNYYPNPANYFIASDPAGNSYIAASTQTGPFPHIYPPHIIRVENTGYVEYDSVLYTPTLGVGEIFFYNSFQYSYPNNELLFSIQHIYYTGPSVNSVYFGEISLGSGDPLWDHFFPNATTTCFRSDAAGNCYINLDQIVLGNHVYKILKYNSVGNLLWDMTNNNAFNNALTFEVDNGGNVYTPGINANGLTIDKISNGTLQWSYNLNFNNGGSPVSPLLIGFSTNNYLVYAFSDINGQGIIRYNQCSILACNINPTLTITNALNATCDNGKIKVNLGGTFQVYPHIRLYNAANLLVDSITKPLGSPNHTFLNLDAGAYTVKVYDAAYDCCEEVLTAKVKCAAPSAGFTTTNITSTGAKVNWNVSSCATGYRVQYRVQGSSTWTTTSVNTNTGYKSLTGLQPLTVYDWRVATKCANFTTAVYSGYSAIQNFTTLCACSKPAGITASSISATSATITWTGNNCTVKYKLLYRVQGTTPWITKTINAPALTKTLTGLSPNTVYEYKMRSDCDGTGTFNSGYTNIQTFATLLRLGEETTSAISESEQFEINIRPNPVSEEFTLNFESGYATAQIKIVNTIGQTVFSKQLYSEEGMFETQLSVSDLKSGVYVLIVQTENEIGQKCFMKE